MANRIRRGDATLTRVLELQVEMSTSLFASTPPDAWPENADLLDRRTGIARPGSGGSRCRVG